MHRHKAHTFMVGNKAYSQLFLRTSSGKMKDWGTDINIPDLSLIKCSIPKADTKFLTHRFSWSLQQPAVTQTGKIHSK